MAKSKIYMNILNILKGLFLLKSIGPRNLNIIVNLKNTDIKFQVGMKRLRPICEQFTRLRNDNSCLREIDYLYAWGEDQKLT